MQGPYYQPLDPPERVQAGEWGRWRAKRKPSEVMELKQSALVRQTERGYALELESSGTDGVPVAVEISLRPGGVLEGCRKDARVPGTWLLDAGSAVYRAEGAGIRFGLGLGAHRYTQVRGAEARLAGWSVYVCGFTPFRRVVEFECL
jgi:hypothetical protein